MIRVRTILVVLAFGLAVWGGWRGVALDESDSAPAAGLARVAPLATAGDPLPKAQETPSAWPSATPSATASRTRVVPTARPTHTPTATAIPSPTATPTPIHAPAAGPPTRITISKLDLDSPVVGVGIIERYVDGVLHREWAVADGAAGFHEGMAWPGQVGNTVLSGHNNIRGEVFRDIHQLEPGDDVLVWVGEENGYRYTVATVLRLPIKGAPSDVLEDNLKWIQPTDDERLTLVTCWPPWSNTHRTVVVAYPAAWSEP